MAEIRPRAVADLERCIETLQLVHRTDQYPLNWPVQPERWLAPPDLLQAWVAVEAATVLGHIAVTAGATQAQLLQAAGCGMEKFACISQLFVGPAARGQRLGHRLIEVASDFAARQQRRLGLEVVEQPMSPAVALYERLGWRLVARCKAQWTDSYGGHPPLRLYLSPA